MPRSITSVNSQPIWSSFVFYDAVKNDHGFQYDPFKAIVAPRPIGWISTLSESGAANLAPYSFFNAFAEEPHYVAFGSGGYKHTIANVERSKEFAVNLATFSLREAMNATSASVASHSDEFELAGLTKTQCEFIAAPRVGESPVALECRHFQTVPLPDDEGRVSDWLVIGRVIGIHIADQFITDGRVDTSAMQPIARLGYSEYATVTEAWRMRRPG
jgi:flavin reductase (DIM6/NTAB) family NADH-FMN oxidoreductase RutF